MSADQPDVRALAELETVIRRLAEELATWRRRALKAEAQRSELGEDHDAVASRSRILDLNGENTELRARLAAGAPPIHVRQADGRLLLHTIFTEVLGREVAPAERASAYADSFAAFVRSGVENELLDPRLLQYDLNRLGGALKAQLRQAGDNARLASAAALNRQLVEAKGLYRQNMQRFAQIYRELC